MCFGGREKGSDPPPKPAQYPSSSQNPTQSYPGYQGPITDIKMCASSPPQYAPPGQQYVPPPGAPQNSQETQYAPPPGPQQSQNQSQYAPPPGPPPGNTDYTAPPAGPPPTDKPKPQHDWEAAVPDTSLFPPPPAFFSGWDRSPANNATEEEAKAGEAWCRDNPLCPPITLDPAAVQALQTSNFRLMQPWGFRGSMAWMSPGVWNCRTESVAPDSCIIGYPPLYTVTLHSPLATGHKMTVYYEVYIRPESRPEETSLAIGFTALPYPNFRLPGWHRGSLAVHGDDGHRYINDRWGGLSFVPPFNRGDTIGLGMVFEPVQGKLKVNVFFTKEGKMVGQWDLHEEQDSDVNIPVTGLEGFHDLSCAIGTFNHVSFDVIFDPTRWKYRPY